MADVRAPLGAVLCAALLLGPMAGVSHAAPKPKPSAGPTGSPSKPHGATGRGQARKHPTPTPAPTAPSAARPTTAAAPRPVAVAPAPVRTTARRTSSAVTPRTSPTAGPTAAPSRAPHSPRAAAPTRPAGVAPVARALTGVATRDPQLPLGILLVVGVFLLVQNRIDRKDPKLADLDVDDLAFSLPRSPRPVVVPRVRRTAVQVSVAPESAPSPVAWS